MAVTVKPLGVRDWFQFGVQVRVVPFSAAPSGALVRLNVTAPPAGSVADIVYE
jgi:hypothetical protein